MFRAAAVCSTPATLKRLRRAGRMALACSALALLSACGGGDRAEEYKPDRIVVFGDENSAFKDEPLSGQTIKGLVYTVNPVAQGGQYCGTWTDPTAKCLDNDVLDGIVRNFVSGNAALPWGTGTYDTPDSSGKPFNTVRLIGTGTGEFTPAAPAGAASQPGLPVKRDAQAGYACFSPTTVVQHIAHAFGKGFNEACPIGVSGAFTYADLGKKVSDLQTQVNQAIGAGQLGKGTLAVVWIGHNDIIEITQDNTTYGTLAAKILEAKVRADRLAQVVIQIIKTGAKVAVIGVADVGYAPWATSVAGLTCDGRTRSACAVQLVASFNDTLKLGDPQTGLKGLQEYTFRGREYTFVEGGAIVDGLATSSSYNNKKVCAMSGDPDVVSPASAAASQALPSIKPDGTIAVRGPAPDNIFPVEYCSTQSLVFGGNLDTYLWADERRPAPVVHRAIANAVLVRVINQF